MAAAVPCRREGVLLWSPAAQQSPVDSVCCVVCVATTGPQSCATSTPKHPLETAMRVRPSARALLQDGHHASAPQPQPLASTGATAPPEIPQRASQTTSRTPAHPAKHAQHAQQRPHPSALRSDNATSGISHGPDQPTASNSIPLLDSPASAIPGTPASELASDVPAAVMEPSAPITAVYTPNELQQALSAGVLAQDIEIRAHLDLRTLRLAENPYLWGRGNDRAGKAATSSHIAYISAPTRSIRVRYDSVHR